MATTTQLRNWWAPPCQGPWARVALFGDGVVSVRPAIVDAVVALSNCLEVFGYRSRAVDTGAYNCRKTTGGTGYSLHAYGIALDINWQSNPYGPTLVTDMPRPMIDAILRLRTRNGSQVWRWGGDYRGNKDAMHFEIVCDRADLGTGIDPTTLPQTTPPPEDDMTPAQELMLRAALDTATRCEEKLALLTPFHEERFTRTARVVPAGTPNSVVGDPTVRWGAETVLAVRDIAKRIAALEAKLG